mmetsp:Transcript_4664/g.7003  ORF Transcript_4664/g.7003 Transcript_4664/m.7003 type:complete len:507 (-) Transcript_4664:434-1954(-)
MMHGKVDVGGYLYNWTGWSVGIARGLRMSAVLSVWSLAATVVALLPWLWRRWNSSQRSAADVDLSRNMTVYNPIEICKRSGDAMERFWCAEFGLANFGLNIPFFLVYCCVIFLLYLKCSRAQVIIWFTAACLAYFGTITLVLDPSYEISRHSKFAGFACYLTPVIFLKLSQPKDSSVWIQAMKFLCMPVVFSLLYNYYYELISIQLVFLCLVWPISREMLSYVGRSITYALGTDPHIASRGTEVRREFAWSFVLIIQVFTAIWYRLGVAKLASTEEFIFFMVFSTLSEVALRLTVVRRDDLIKRLVHAISCKRIKKTRPTSVIHPSTGQILSTVEVVDAEDEVQRSWVAQVCIGEMVSEYIGLFATTGLVLIHKDAIMILPLPIFGEAPMLFDESIDTGNFLFKQAIQYVGELFVDAVCIAVEQLKFERPIERHWESQSRWSRGINLFLAASVGLSKAVLLMYTGIEILRSTQECYSTDMCSCAPPPGGVQGRYCLRLYPHTNGLP